MTDEILDLLLWLVTLLGVMTTIAVEATGFLGSFSLRAPSSLVYETLPLNLMGVWAREVERSLVVGTTWRILPPPLFGDDLILLPELHNHGRELLFCHHSSSLSLFDDVFCLPRPEHAFELRLRGRLIFREVLIGGGN